MTTLIAALIAIAASLAAAVFAAADGALLALAPGDPNLSPPLRSLAERRERPHRALAFARSLPGPHRLSDKAVDDLWVARCELLHGRQGSGAPVPDEGIAALHARVA